MIRLENLSKYFPTRYGPRYVFRDLSMVIPDDRDVAILGPNGAGKSTLLNIMGGLDRPSSGTIVTNRRISWPLGLSSGFQKAMTGRENVRFICRVYGQTVTRDTEEYVKDFCELGSHYEMPVRSYSSGMRAKYNLAVSMAFDFDTYLMDEILAVGDAAFKKKCAKVLANKRRGSNIILVTHQMTHVRRHCNAAVVLVYGQAEYYENVERAIYRYVNL